MDSSVSGAVLRSLTVSVVTLTIIFGSHKIYERFIDPKGKLKSKAAQRRRELCKSFGRPEVETNEYEDIISEDAVNPADIKTGFDDVRGLDSTKEKIKDLLILPLKRPDLFGSESLVSPTKGILLYGPPGTGKTLLAKAIAKESGSVFLNMSMSTLQDKWFGESQKLVRAVFTLAVKLQPTVIFIDELDSFFKTRDSDHHCVATMKAEFMTLWDGVLTDDSARVVVVGATNKPHDVDSAIQRRLPQTFLVDLPGYEQRLDILRYMLRKEPVPSTFDFELLARETDGYSGSDLKELCSTAAMIPVRELVQSDDDNVTGVRAVTVADFLIAKQDVRPTGESAHEYLTILNSRTR